MKEASLSFLISSSHDSQASVNGYLMKPTSYNTFKEHLHVLDDISFNRLLKHSGKSDVNDRMKEEILLFIRCKTAQMKNFYLPCYKSIEERIAK